MYKKPHQYHFHHLHRPELILSAEDDNPLISGTSLGGSDFLPLPSPDDLFAVGKYECIINYKG